MSFIIEYLQSGILEMYVLGVTTEDETVEVESMMALHKEVLDEVMAISETMKKYADTISVKPCPTVKPFLLATIDFQERIKNGEKPSVPPLLNENSTIEMFDSWLSRTDMVLPESFTDYHARIIGYTPEAISAIVWIKSSSPNETHHDEFEKFLVVEGTCDIIIGTISYSLIPGDFLEIPLHIGHEVKVTSEVPCKVILQRVQVNV